MARPRGFEPLTYGSGGSKGRLGKGSTGSQRVENVGETIGGASRSSPPSARVRSPFAAPVLHAGCDALLAVREVAARLGVSTATVYALCERGHLNHVRVLNAIRVGESDLVEFVAANKTRADVPAKSPAIRPATRQVPASDSERNKS